MPLHILPNESSRAMRYRSILYRTACSPEGDGTRYLMGLPAFMC